MENQDAEEPDGFIISLTAQVSSLDYGLSNNHIDFLVQDDSL